MKLICQQIEAHPSGAANIRRGKTVGHAYKELHPVAGALQVPLRQCPKLDDAIANHVGPLA